MSREKINVPIVIVTKIAYNDAMVDFENSWNKVLEGEFDKPYYLKLRKFLVDEYRHRVIYPDMNNIFNALKLTDYGNVKAVIVGQDPYHEPNQAHGLAFSVQKGVVKPPSLVNIFKELESDLGLKIPSHGCLEDWAKRGVLLINSVLTVRAHQANSHRGKGWETFTDGVISKLNEREEPVVFILWGGNARSKKMLVTNKRHLILEAPHPSPLSAYRGFFDSRHFSECNNFLDEPIDWSID